MVPDRIEREVLIAAPAERVWSLITEADHLGRWFGDAGAEIDLRPGGAMAVSWEKHGTARARVIAVDPPVRFVFVWAPYADPGGDEPVEGNSTRVEFTLAPDADGTRLRVVETGFAALAAPPEQQAANHRSNTEGWGLELAELAGYAQEVAV